MPGWPTARSAAGPDRQDTALLGAAEGRQTAPSSPLAPPWTPPGDGRMVAVSGAALRMLPSLSGSPIAGRPVTIDVALGLALLGLTGSVTDVLVTVRAAATHRRPPG